MSVKNVRWPLFSHTATRFKYHSYSSAVRQFRMTSPAILFNFSSHQSSSKDFWILSYINNGIECSIFTIQTKVLRNFMNSIYSLQMYLLTSLDCRNFFNFNFIIDFLNKGYILGFILSGLLRLQHILNIINAQKSPQLDIIFLRIPNAQSCYEKILQFYKHDDSELRILLDLPFKKVQRTIELLVLLTYWIIVSWKHLNSDKVLDYLN